MARKPINMRYAKDILRLKYQNQLSVREIAGSCGLPASTVGVYLQRAEAAGLTWPLPEEIFEVQLTERLFRPAAAPPPGGAAKPVPDWPALHEQLRRKSVTLQLLWQEYHHPHPEGYHRSQFCQLYRDWAGLKVPTGCVVPVCPVKLPGGWSITHRN